MTQIEALIDSGLERLATLKSFDTTKQSVCGIHIYIYIYIYIYICVCVCVCVTIPPVILRTTERVTGIVIVINSLFCVTIWRVLLTTVQWSLSLRGKWFFFMGKLYFTDGWMNIIHIGHLFSKKKKQINVHVVQIFSMFLKNKTQLESKPLYWYIWLKIKILMCQSSTT